MGLLFLSNVMLSCHSFEELEVIGEPEIKLYGLEDGNINYGLILNLKNPNSQSFRVKKAEFLVSINGSTVGKSRLADKVTIHGNQTATYTFPMTGSFEGKEYALDLALQSLFGRGFKLGLTGEIKAGSFFIVNYTFPVEWEERVDF